MMSVSWVIKDFTDCSVRTLGKVLSPRSILFHSGPRLYFPPSCHPPTPAFVSFPSFLPFLLCPSILVSLFLLPFLSHCSKQNPKYSE